MEYSTIYNPLSKNSHHNRHLSNFININKHVYNTVVTISSNKESNSLQQNITHSKKYSFNHKRNHSGNIFRLPRSILQSQTLSPVNNNQQINNNVNKQYKHLNKQYSNYFNQQNSLTSLQKTNRQKFNTQFIKQYRDNLRKTIYNQTKNMLRPNKINDQKNISEKKFDRQQKIQRKSNQKMPPYISKKKIEQISSTNILYKTIVNQNSYHHFRKKIEPLQLAVYKLPIFQTNKKKNRKCDFLFQEDQHRLKNYQPSILNENVNIRKMKGVSISDKNLIQPWGFVQQFSFNQDQVL